MNNSKLGELIIKKDRRALARSITLVENQSSLANDILHTIMPYTGNAHIIGITGPPGSGKSTLVDKIIGKYRNNENSVGVIAVDPSSPFTGGAILGDRIRMLQFTKDKSVFIRSMSSRGKLGGLSPNTFSVIALMDAYGFDKIIVETVGIGQSEIDIIQNSDTTVVLSIPGLGDDIQTIKAGIMEIADIFTVHKSDLPGSQYVAQQINAMMDLLPEKKEWRPPVVLTSAINEDGLDELIDQIENHLIFLRNTDEINKLHAKRLENEVKLRLTELVTERIQINGEQSLLKKAVDRVISQKITPLNAAKELLDEIYDTNHIK